MSGFCFMLCTLYNLKPFITCSSKRTSKISYAKHPYVVKTKQLHEHRLPKNCTHWNARLLVPKGLATGHHSAFPPFRYSKCRVGTQNPRCNAFSLCKAPNTNFKSPAQTQLSPRYQNFSIVQPSKHNIQPKCSTSFFRRTFQ
jgi:hypothetical protein